MAEIAHMKELLRDKGVSPAVVDSLRPGELEGLCREFPGDTLQFATVDLLYTNANVRSGLAAAIVHAFNPGNQGQGQAGQVEPWSRKRWWAEAIVEAVVVGGHTAAVYVIPSLATAIINWQLRYMTDDKEKAKILSEVWWICVLTSPYRFGNGAEAKAKVKAFVSNVMFIWNHPVKAAEEVAAAAQAAAEVPSAEEAEAASVVVAMQAPATHHD